MSSRRSSGLVEIWEEADSDERARRRSASLPPLPRFRPRREEERRRSGVPILLGSSGGSKALPLGLAGKGWFSALRRGDLRGAGLELLAALSASTLAGAIAFGIVLAVVAALTVAGWRWLTAVEFPEAGVLPWFGGRPSDRPTAAPVNEGLLGKIPGIYRHTGKELDDTLLVLPPRDSAFDGGEAVSTAAAGAQGAIRSADRPAPEGEGLLARFGSLPLSTGAAGVGPAGIGQPGGRGFRLIALGPSERTGPLGRGGAPESAPPPSPAADLRDAPGLPARAELGRASPRGVSRRAANGGLRRSGVSARLAMGQLKFAGSLARAASAASGERAAGAASAAFEQQAQAGGGLAAAPASGIGAFPGGPGVSLNNTGAQSGVQAPEFPEFPDAAGGPMTPLAPIPEVGPEVDVTPYQADVDRARLESDQARQEDNMGTMMIMMAGAMIVAAAALLEDWITFAAGVAMMAAGLMMMMQGKGKKKKAKDHAKAAKNLGEKVGSTDEQKKQGEIIQQDAAAAAVGQKATPPAFEAPPTGVREAVERERDAGFVLQARPD